MASSGAPCNNNIILASDSYKISHHFQYPPGTEKVFSYFECRGGKHKEIVFFGLQYILKRWLAGVVVTKEKVEEAAALYKVHLGPGIFNYDGWMHILNTHGGMLPLRIKAIPEGTLIPYKNVLFTVENTDPKCFWLTNFVETLMVQVWYPLTICSNSRVMKQCIANYLDETADDLTGLPFKLHDFGFRGCTCVEAASIGACAHLVNFRGTDTVAALLTARNYYGCDCAGFSIPAAEHSTITTWTRSGEAQAFKNMLTKFDSGAVAVVSDSYNIWDACEHIWGEELKDLVEKRGLTGPVVVRPDSGDPCTVVVKVLNLLGLKFGTTLNSKGYKMLPPYIRVIQGDGINCESLGEILEHMKNENWSADNISFGSGGALLQKFNRDTHNCAYKCSYVIINGEGVNVFKEPITDLGKKSKKGLLSLELDEDGRYFTQTENLDESKTDQLVTVFENGKLVRDYSLDEIRRRAELPIVLNNSV